MALDPGRYPASAEDDALLEFGDSYGAHVYTLEEGNVKNHGAGGAPGTGASACVDGSFTGYACGTLNRFDVCINEQDPSTGEITHVCTASEIDADKSIIQPGDSGGPVLSGSDVSPAGTKIVIGIATSSSNGGKQAFMTDIGSTLSAFDANIPSP